MKAIIWNIWFARNDLIFNVNVVLAFATILKCDRIILSWLSTMAENSSEKLDDSIPPSGTAWTFLGNSWRRLVVP